MKHIHFHSGNVDIDVRHSGNKPVDDIEIETENESDEVPIDTQKLKHVVSKVVKMVKSVLIFFL